MGASWSDHHWPVAAASGGSSGRRHGDAPRRSLQPPVPHGENQLFLSFSVETTENDAEQWS